MIFLHWFYLELAWYALTDYYYVLCNTQRTDTDNFFLTLYSLNESKIWGFKKSEWIRKEWGNFEATYSPTLMSCNKTSLEIKVMRKQNVYLGYSEPELEPTHVCVAEVTVQRSVCFWSLSLPVVDPTQHWLASVRDAALCVKKTGKQGVDFYFYGYSPYW